MGACVGGRGHRGRSEQSKGGSLLPQTKHTVTLDCRLSPLPPLEQKQKTKFPNKQVCVVSLCRRCYKKILTQLVCALVVSAVGLWSDPVGADDPGTDPLRGHRPLRDVGLPEGRLPNSTADQLPRRTVSWLGRACNTHTQRHTLVHLSRTSSSHE